MARAVSFAGAAVGLVALSPIIAATAAVVRQKIGTPVLFRQVRAGRSGAPFVVFKFKTMTDERDAHGELLPDERRLTAVGRFLRSTSLDELPQLWNVLRGDMNLVGPRPLLMDYLPLYTAEQARRHEVRPGMTSWVAIHGRNLNSWAKQLEMDVWYVDNRSVSLDLRIILQTIPKVIQRDGITQASRATRDRFQGTGAKVA
ncbi:MAG: sugar transferase [Polyangiaceae bacterium]|nr:sugar transferase [Polyangiaceae bacterium]